MDGSAQDQGDRMIMATVHTHAWEVHYASNFPIRLPADAWLRRLSS